MLWISILSSPPQSPLGLWGARPASHMPLGLWRGVAPYWSRDKANLSEDINSWTTGTIPAVVALCSIVALVTAKEFAMPMPMASL